MDSRLPESKKEAHDVAPTTPIMTTGLSFHNTVDPWTQETIELENQVVIPDGSFNYQFDAASLLEYMKFIPIESWTNPFNRRPFSQTDKQTIIKAVNEYAKRENKEIKLCSVNPHPHGDPGYEATIALVRRLTISIGSIPEGNETRVFRERSELVFMRAFNATYNRDFHRDGSASAVMASGFLGFWQRQGYRVHSTSAIDRSHRWLSGETRGVLQNVYNSALSVFSLFCCCRSRRSQQSGSFNNNTTDRWASYRR